MGSPRPVLARGKTYMPWLMVRRNINVASRYHESVIGWDLGGLPAHEAESSLAGNPRLVLDSPRKAIGLHLSGDLRHIVAEHDDVVLLA
jgi:hypothetical protein